MPNEQTKNKASQKRIMDAYIELMRTKPYDRITVKEIVKEAGVARSTFYLYFDNVFNLLEEIESALSGVNVFYLRPPEKPKGWETAAESIVQWFDFCKKNSVYLSALLGENGDTYFEERIRYHLRKEIIRMMDDDDIPDDCLRPYYIELMLSTHLCLMKFWLQDDQENSILQAKVMASMANQLRLGAFYDTYIFEVMKDSVEQG